MIKSGEALLCAMEEMARYGISFSDSAINAFAEGLLARSVTGEKLGYTAGACPCCPRRRQRA